MVLDHLIAATYNMPADKAPHLRAANLGLEKMRFGVRLSKDLRHLDLKAYEYAARAIDEVGRMVGGWIKSDRAGSRGASADARSQNAAPA